MALNPIGNVVVVPGFNAIVAKMQEAWAALKAAAGKVDMTDVTAFLTQCLDNLIVYLVQHDIPGPDKKATVLAAIDKLYDTVITGVLPFYLRPFSGWIKDYIVNAQMSHLIDWIVSKYQSGSWSPATSTAVLAKYSLSIA